MNQLSVDIVKHGGKRPREKFVRDKLFQSIKSVCRSARVPDGQADSIANSVCDGVEQWLSNRHEVTSMDIRIVATKHLNNRHPEAAYLYENDNRII